MPADISALMDSNSVRDTIAAARTEAAQKMGVTEDKVFWRLTNHDDWTGTPDAVLAAGTGTTTYVAGANLWAIASIRNIGVLAVFVGWSNQGLVGAVTNIQFALNGNRHSDVPEAFIDTGENNMIVWPAGPVIIQPECRVGITATVGAGLAPAAAVPARPILIVFPACG